MLNMNHTVDMLHYSDAKHYSIAVGPPKNFRNFKIQGGPKSGPFLNVDNFAMLSGRKAHDMSCVNDRCCFVVCQVKIH